MRKTGRIIYPDNSSGVPQSCELFSMCGPPFLALDSDCYCRTPLYANCLLPCPPPPPPPSYFNTSLAHLASNLVVTPSSKKDC